MAKTKATSKSKQTTPKSATKDAKAAAADARKAAVSARAAATKARVAAIKKPDVRSKAQGFTDFIRKQGVIGLAVGLAIGTQASELVRNIVSSIITPMVDLLVGKGGLDGLTWYTTIGDRAATFNFGLLIDSLIKFMAVALVIYFVIMGLKLDKLDKKKDA